MPDFIYLLAVLACPIGMGVMMLVMMRGNHARADVAPSGDEVARLRAEVDHLRAQSDGGAQSSANRPSDVPGAP